MFSKFSIYAWVCYYYCFRRGISGITASSLYQSFCERPGAPRMKPQHPVVNLHPVAVAGKTSLPNQVLLQFRLSYSLPLFSTPLSAKGNHSFYYVCRIYWVTSATVWLMNGSSLATPESGPWISSTTQPYCSLLEIFPSPSIRDAVDSRFWHQLFCVPQLYSHQHLICCRHLHLLPSKCSSKDTRYTWSLYMKLQHLFRDFFLFLGVGSLNYFCPCLYRIYDKFRRSRTGIFFGFRILI